MSPFPGKTKDFSLPVPFSLLLPIFISGITRCKSPSQLPVGQAYLMRSPGLKISAQLSCEVPAQFGH